MNIGKATALFLAAFIATNVASACISTPAWGQAAQQQPFSTYNTSSGDLLKNPTTRAVLEKHFPGVSKSFQMKMVKGKTFRQLHEMAPDRLPSAKLDAVDRDLRNVAR